MGVPLSILASALAIADASKKVIDVCTDYVKHAKNALKEIHAIIHDIHDLVATVKKIESLSKSLLETSVSAQGYDQEYDQFAVPLIRLKEYIIALVNAINRQDLRIGVFHELGFRARWPATWRKLQDLLPKIDKEKSKVHLATAIDGT